MPEGLLKGMEVATQKTRDAIGSEGYSQSLAFVEPGSEQRGSGQ